MSTHIIIALLVAVVLTTSGVGIAQLSAADPLPAACGGRCESCVCQDCACCKCGDCKCNDCDCCKCGGCDCK